MHDVLASATDDDAPWITFLLKRGANPTIPNTNGETPISIAERKKLSKILEIFRQWKAND